MEREAPVGNEVYLSDVGFDALFRKSNCQSNCALSNFMFLISRGTVACCGG